MPSDVATNTMMRLPASELMTMRDDFLREGSQGLKLAQFVRVMLRRGRQAQVNDWTQEANKRRMSGLSLGDRPHFDSDNDDVDDDPEIRDEHGNIKGLVDSQGRPNLEAIDDLCELFDSIDVNGDERLEWDEFTRCVIEHGMAGAKREAHDRYQLRDIRPDKESVFGDYKPGEGGDGPLKFLRWLPEMRLLCVCAAGTFGLFPPFPRQQALRLPPKPVYTDALEVTDAEAIGGEDVSDDDGEDAETDAVGVVCFNLGYLPGPTADKGVRTRRTTTVSAVASGVRVLRPGGVLTVVGYTGHEGGWEEVEVMELVSSLDPREFTATNHSVVNRDNCPQLIAVHRKETK